MNILVVMADQFVPFLTSPYGDPVAKTPNLQRLGAMWDEYEGVEIPIPKTPAHVEYPAMDVCGNDLRALRSAYDALASYVDRKLGGLLEAVPEDTVVVVTSDHGDMLAERAMVQKRCFYEWSAPIPLIVRHLDRRGTGTAVAEPVSLLDLAPTIHGHGEQLFELAADPGEWNNLAPRPEADELRALILEEFDPDAIARDGVESVARRELIARAMAQTTTRWDYSPVFDATKQYVR